MQIHELKLNQKRKPKKVIGRGGKQGTYSGKGMNGQKARSGASINPLFEGGRSSLVDRLKKNRGFKSRKVAKNEINLSQVEKNFSDGDTISLEKLIEKGLVQKKLVKGGVKVLADGKEKSFSKKVTFDKDIKLSSSVRKSLGGSEKKEKK